MRSLITPTVLPGNFRLDQHFPKSSDVPREAASTGVLAGYWLDLTQVSLSLKFFIPDGSRHEKPSSHYARWWTNSLYSYFQHGVNFLVELKTSLAYSEELPSPTPKGIVEELPLPTLEGFTLPIPRDTVEELHSAAPIEVEQILPSHYDDEVDYEPSPLPPTRISPYSKEGDVDQEKIVEKAEAVVQEEVDAIEENTSWSKKLQKGSLWILIQLLPHLETRLQRFFDGAAAIEKVISLPTFTSSARLSLEQYSSEFARQEAEMAELEKILADKRAANAELSNRMNMAKIVSGIRFNERKNRREVAEAERELIEAKEGHIPTTELAALRDLITNFENYHKNI
uniref:Aminotransferase-like plant mobile domain-containing protein n=1 Tax=Ananas comosus var. bracteatus TaxID=296719 RepID=A0A6V7NF41_ANACO|nr:unnamed protein product [Ananas comosus var. bracteatus]